MDTLPIFHVKVLQVLACRYGMSFTLEELSALWSSMDAKTVFTINIETENDRQARILDALIILYDKGYIFLNSITDKSIITVKGLIKVQNKVFCN